MNPTRSGLAAAAALVRAGRLREATTLLGRTVQPSAAGSDPTGILARLFPQMDAAGPGQGRPMRSAVHRGPAGSMPYRLFLPATRQATAMPLLVMLHGCTQTPEDFAVGTGMNLLAETEGIAVAYPEQMAVANRQRCWNWFDPAHQQRHRGELALIAGIVRETLASHALDADRVYVAGLSAGGAAAALMAATHPDLVAAVGIHSGLAAGAASDLPGALAAMRGDRAAGCAVPVWPAPVPAIVLHGDRDAVVHPVNADEIATQARAALAPQLRSDVVERDGRAGSGRTWTRSMQLDDKGRPLLERWTLHGGGHGWSGGSTAGSWTEPAGPDASAAMLRFFRHHRRR